MIRKGIILLSLVYLAALAAAWIASYRDMPPLLRMDDRRLYATVADGHLVIVEDAPPLDWRNTDFPTLPDEEVTNWLTQVVRYREHALWFLPSGNPIWYYHGNVASPNYDVFTVLSLRVFALPTVPMFLALAAFALRRSIRRYRRRKHDQCTNCGFDLGGLPDWTCPECGRPDLIRRARLRRWARRAGTVLCIVIVLGSIASLYGYVAYFGPSGKVSNWVFAINSCALKVHFDPEWGLPPGFMGWHCRRASAVSADWAPRIVRNVPSQGSFTVVVPFWVVLLAAGIPTAWLWRRDRRSPKGHCRKCGYNLTGNTSGVCPECGHTTPAANR